MAKAHVELTCADCGRTYIREKICRNRAEANSWENWMGLHYDGICTDCWKAQQAAKREAETLAFIESHKLPELSGTPKQIAWANKIRANVLREIEAYWADDEPGDPTDPVHQAKMAGQQAFMAWLEGQDISRWWIDNQPDRLPRSTYLVETYLKLWPGLEKSIAEIEAAEATIQ